MKIVNFNPDWTADQLNHVQPNACRPHKLIALHPSPANQPLPPIMPKRKSIPSPTRQPSLTTFLHPRKHPHLLQPLTKKTKLKADSPPPSPSPCKSTRHPSCPSTSELVSILAIIDEVLIFAQKPLLWTQIQEEIYSLHKRYPATLPRKAVVDCYRSVTLEQVKAILSVFRDYYVIETGYRKVTQGGYVPEYKFSIPTSQSHNRLSRFEKAVQVSPSPPCSSRSQYPFVGIELIIGSQSTRC